jgi:hypothetical protein
MQFFQSATEAIGSRTSARMFPVLAARERRRRLGDEFAWIDARRRANCPSTAMLAETATRSIDPR